MFSLSAFDCGPAREWDEYAAHVGEAITLSEDGMWQAMTDERIRAVMPMAGEGWWLFGEKGLATVDRSVLIIAGTQDELYPENALVYKHLGTPDKVLISFVGDGHMVMVMDRDHIAHIANFATAFFGYYLQGREEYAQYFRRILLGNMMIYSGEYTRSDRECRRTPRALDWWDSAAFSGIFYTRTESCSQSFIYARPPANNANR